MKKYTPVGPTLLLRPAYVAQLQLDDVTGLRKEGQIIIPENANIKKRGETPFEEFRVVARGPGCTQVKEGDLVIVNKNALIRVPAGDEDLALALETNIAAIIEDVPDAVEKKT